MNDEQKIQIARQIVAQAENNIKNLNYFLQLISILEKLNKDDFVLQLVPVVGGSNEHWQQRIQGAKDNAFLCPKLIEKNEHLKSSFQEEEVVLTLAPQYIQLVNSELNSRGNINNVSDWISQSFQHIERITDDSLEYNIRIRAVQNINNILSVFSDGFVLGFLQSLAQLDTFEHFRNIEHSIVIVGANGSGKSSFSRNTRKILGGNIVIISAQKIFSIRKIENLPLGEKLLQNVHSFQLDEKLGKNWDNQHISQNTYIHDLHNLMLSLLAEHNKKANNFYSGSKNGKEVKRETSMLEQVMEIWGKTITHRYMKYEEPYIKIYTDSRNSYDFPNLSDGEKAIFYYIAHILIARENSFIIIDEPENHLHMGIVSRLWDKLEQLRSDCKFIYLTHNLDFASSRINATKLWNKSFIPPAKWDVVSLPENENLPEPLLMELLGSRKKILFCEGDKSSLDYKLYSFLFPNYTIKPVGGHLEVINFTRAFNKSEDVFGNSALGIIDGDFHLESEKQKWESDSIYCIDAQEVENLLCDKDLLEEGKNHFHSDIDSVDKVKNHFFDALSRKKEAQAVEYATQKINNALKSNLIKKPNTLEELEEQFDKSVLSLDINTLVSERKSLFDKIISERNYDDGIRFFNNKGLVGIVGKNIVSNYKNRILRLLESKSELLDIFRSKYFSKIPIE